MTTDRIANPPTRNDNDGDVGGDLEVRRHRQPDRGPHREHRLRAGRDRRAAGQPDALQPVPAREARVLPRGPRPVRLRPRRRRVGWRRRRARRQLRRLHRRALHVLQPAHRPQSRPRRADRRRRPPDRQGRRVGRRRAQHPDRRRSRCRRRRRPTSPWRASSATSCAAAPSARCSPIATSCRRTSRGSNQAYGVDAAFGFYQNVALGGYYARTETTNLDRRQRKLPGASSTGCRIATASRPSS